MTKEFAERLQKEIVAVLRKAGDRPLQELARQYCPEVALLAGNWVLDELPDARVYVLKGIIDRETHHDLLLVEYERKAYAFDPIVWKFFRNKKTGLVAIKGTMVEAIAEIQKLYGGIWRISEKMQKSGFERRSEWERRIETKMDELD